MRRPLTSKVQVRPNEAMQEPHSYPVVAHSHGAALQNLRLTPHPVSVPPFHLFSSKKRSYSASWPVFGPHIPSTGPTYHSPTAPPVTAGHRSP